jgi:hypothetical protein
MKDIFEGLSTVLIENPSFCTVLYSLAVETQKNISEFLSLGILLLESVSYYTGTYMEFSNSIVGIHG